MADVGTGQHRYVVAIDINAQHNKGPGYS
jgi:hypothetical protein